MPLANSCAFTDDYSAQTFSVPIPTSSNATTSTSDTSVSRPSSSQSDSTDSGFVSESWLGSIGVPTPSVRSRHTSEDSSSVRSRHTSESSSPSLRSRHTSESSSSEYAFSTCGEHQLPEEYYCIDCVQETCKQCISRGHEGHKHLPTFVLRGLREECAAQRKRWSERGIAIRKLLEDLNKMRYEESQKIKRSFTSLQAFVSAREQELREGLNVYVDRCSKSLMGKYQQMMEVSNNFEKMHDKMSEHLGNGDMELVARYGRQMRQYTEQLHAVNFTVPEQEPVRFNPPSDYEVHIVKTLGSMAYPTCTGTWYGGVNGSLNSFSGSNSMNSFDSGMGGLGVSPQPSSNLDGTTWYDPFQSFSPPSLPQSPAATQVPLSTVHNIAAALAALPPVVEPTTNFSMLPQQPFSPTLPSPNATVDQALNGITASVTSMKVHDTTAGRPFFRPTTTKPHSDLRVGFHTTRRYSRIRKPVTVFGKEGAGDEELCRPWGVCCDSQGHVIVADRSNNRIQIFRSDGTHVRSFGCFGSEQGEFNRPAGVAIDLKGRIVVCDKDNHRVQVLSIEGKFILAFGSRGSAHGTFNYPWDVAVNPLTNEYAISDTRNHRVQMFNDAGEHLMSFGFAHMSPVWQTFDSPRGLWFTPEGNLLVTDFNAHRVYEVQCRKANAYRWESRMVNVERYRHWELLRPQKVTMDQEGNILVSDCKNNRIQVFRRDGMRLACIGVAGSEPGQFDRPSGITMTPDGKLVVVDFGNHRIQMF